MTFTEPEANRTMTIGVRRTAEGIVFAVGVVKSFGWLIVVCVAAVTYGIRTSDRIRTAVPAKEFTDTTAAIRRDMQLLAIEARQASERSTSIGCYIAKYPAGLCDDVRAPVRASARRAP